MDIQSIVEAELLEKHSVAALFYLIESGREVEFNFNGKKYFVSKDGSVKYCSLWKDKREQAFDSMEELFMDTMIDNRKFYVVWDEVKILTLY